MIHNKQEHLSLKHVIAVGKRQAFPYGEDGEDSWEVFVRLASGADAIVAFDGTAQQANSVLKRTLAELGAADLHFVVTGDDVYLNTHSVERVYVDTQENAWVVLVEDVKGNGYLLERGSRAECEASAAALAEAISSYL